MSDRIERCTNCDEPTGRAGRADDSLYLDDDRGPFCMECWMPERIDEQDAEIATLKGTVEEQRRALAAKWADGMKARAEAVPTPTEASDEETVAELSLGERLSRWPAWKREYARKFLGSRVPQAPNVPIPTEDEEPQVGAPLLGISGFKVNEAESTLYAVTLAIGYMLEEQVRVPPTGDLRRALLVDSTHGLLVQARERLIQEQRDAEASIEPPICDVCSRVGSVGCEGRPCWSLDSVAPGCPGTFKAPEVPTPKGPLLHDPGDGGPKCLCCNDTGSVCADCGQTPCDPLRIPGCMTLGTEPCPECAPTSKEDEASVEPCNQQEMAGVAAWQALNWIAMKGSRPKSETRTDQEIARDGMAKYVEILDAPSCAAPTEDEEPQAFDG